MKTIHSGLTELCISEELFNNYAGLEGGDKGVLDSILQHHLWLLGAGVDKENQGKLLNWCKEYLGKEELSIAVLHAHGGGFFRWTYVDDCLFSHSVQKWINPRDGKYDLLVLASCNEKCFEPRIEKSLALVPSSKIGVCQDSSIEHKLVVPGKGFVYLNNNKIAQLPNYDLLAEMKRYRK